VEYIHEEFYDATSGGKWTIFNKHAIELEDESDMEEQEFKLKEDSIIEKMKLDNQTANDINVSTLPESTWTKLYEAKC